MTFAFDGASAFDLTSAKDHGGIVASVYIVGSPGNMPHADAARVAAIRAAGMGALPNWERANDYFSTCTVADALAAGQEALAACKALGFPTDGSVSVAFSFDFDCPPERYAEMLQKLKAVQQGLGSAFHACAYAQQGLIDYFASHGYPGKHWLMGSTWGQSYNPSSPNVFMVQSHDASGNWLTSPVAGTDINTITDPHAVGAWWPDGSEYGQMPLDPNDPVVKNLEAKIDALAATVRGLGGLIVFGDSADAAAGKVPQTHPNNLTQIHQQTSLIPTVQQALADLSAAVAALTPSAPQSSGGTPTPFPTKFTGTVTLEASQ